MRYANVYVSTPMVCGIILGMNIKEKIIRQFKRLFPGRMPRRNYVSDKELVRRFCRGNVRLQNGQIIFPEEFKLLSDKVSSYEF